MTTRLSNHIRGVLKTFGLLPGSVRGVPFDRRVEAMFAARDDIAPIIRPMLVAWHQLRQQVVIFDKAGRILVKWSPVCRHLIV
jgi:transposase